VKIGIVAPSPVPFTRGGAERAWAGLQRAIDELTPHEAELVKLPVRESTLPEVVEGYRAFARLDVSHFDRVITSKYPAWIVSHPYHVVWMFHPLRGLYDTYHTFGLPERADPTVDEIADLVRFLDGPPLRSELDGCFELWDRALRAAGTDHPELALPSPVARRIVRWLDAVALSPPAVRRHLALSATVANRPGYFPPGTDPIVAHGPSDLGSRTGPGTSYLFTASRLDGPKRFDLLIDAMARVPQEIPLLIGGTGPLGDELRQRAGPDRRVKFLGYVPDRDLAGLYANALAVPFVPADEDYGLITVEAMACGTPVVTCTDSGGPTELVTHGVNGFVTEPEPAAVGAALAALAADPARARLMGRAGRHRALEITWAAVVSEILDQPVRDAARQPVIDLTDEAGPKVIAPPPRPERGVRPKAVVLSTFEIHQPRHGGQLRCAHLYGALARHLDVEVLSLVEHEHKTGTFALGPGFVERAIARSPEHVEIGRRTSHHAGLPVTDILAGTEIDRSPAYLDALRHALDDAALVLLAEPYLLPALEAVGSDRPWIYDAFNVEADLKAGALPRSDLGRDLLAEVAAIEGRAVTGAAGVTTCSIEDARELARLYGRPLDDFTVVPNGTDCGLSVPTFEERARRRDRWLAKWARSTGRPTGQPSGPERLAVFFGSWHPPNLAAAKVILWLAPQLPQVQFVLGGTHGDAFPVDEVPDNVVFTGQVVERVKRTLLSAADVALNPVLHGSGTNLKVIEYLASGVPVVSTAFGVRGLEVGNGRHLLVAEPHEMVAAVEQILDDPRAAEERTRAGRALAVDRYDWVALGSRLAHVAHQARRSDEGRPTPTL
jgi:glycosyltransferase involved in cell wall biosynthesis